MNIVHEVIYSMSDFNRNYKGIILSSAKEIAAEQGITKINIRSVAKNSGISIGTVYNYFPSKGELLVAVIEDFWEDAFSSIDWQSLKHDDFYSNLEKVYNTLYLYLYKFKENWLEQLALLKAQEKLLGQQKQNEYFKKICNKIITLMDMSKDLNQYPWSNTFSKEKIAEFIFYNMLTMLRKGEEDISFLIDIIKRIMKN